MLVNIFLSMGVDVGCVGVVFFFKQKTAYEMRISDWSSDVCSSDLGGSVRSCDLEHQPRRQDDGDEEGEQHRGRGVGWDRAHIKIGRASCRERVCQYV